MWSGHSSPLLLLLLLRLFLMLFQIVDGHGENPPETARLPVVPHEDEQGKPSALEAGRKAEDVAREVGVSKHTIYAWKAKYGGMDVSQAQEAKQLRDENTRLRKLVADLSLDKDALQWVIEKNGWSSRS
jgi:putative transposase